MDEAEKIMVEIVAGVPSITFDVKWLNKGRDIISQALSLKAKQVEARVWREASELAWEYRDTGESGCSTASDISDECKRRSQECENPDAKENTHKKWCCVHPDLTSCPHMVNGSCGSCNCGVVPDAKE